LPAGSAGDRVRHTAPVGQRRGFALHGDAGGFEAGSERVESRGIGNFPAEDLSARLNCSVDEQALFALTGFRFSERIRLPICNG
jgi:hypothetical protein